MNSGLTSPPDAGFKKYGVFLTFQNPPNPNEFEAKKWLQHTQLTNET